MERVRQKRPSLLDTDVYDEKTSPFNSASIASLKRAITSDKLSVSAPLIMGLSRGRGERKLYLIPHVTEEGIVLDLEPISDNSALILEGALQSQSLVKSGVAQLQEFSHEPVEVSMQLICDELRGLLNYDRVMMYQFHEDQHGEVVAESFSKYAEDAFKGMHFPSTDIPQANRAIFMTMRSRMIADVSMEASKVVQSARLSNNILLGTSQLRGVSGCHGQYLSNMGVKATLVLSVVLSGTRTVKAGAGDYHNKSLSDNMSMV